MGCCMSPMPPIKDLNESMTETASHKTMETGPQLLCDANERCFVLKHSNSVNGMILIEICNLDLYWKTDDDDYYYDHQFTVFYRFQHQTNTEWNRWNSKPFDAVYIQNDNKFQLKVPLYLLSYLLEYNIKCQVSKYNNGRTIRLYDVKSQNYTVQIPSILIASTYNIRDRILYHIEGCGFVRHGVVLELMDNNMIKIKRVNIETAQESKTLVIHSSKISRKTQECQFVVDITNRYQMETNLVLRSNDKNIQQTYYTLCDVLSVFCNDNFH